MYPRLQVSGGNATQRLGYESSLDRCDLIALARITLCASALEVLVGRPGQDLGAMIDILIEHSPLLSGYGEI